MILGISGKAGSGKDAAASVLVREHGFVRVAFADALKRVVAQLFGWDDDRLWGPSERRSEPDPAWDGLTARRALQVIGTEVGRALHPDVWVRATMREIGIRQRMFQTTPCVRERCFIHDGEACAVGHMSRAECPNGRAGIPRFVIPDLRFKNEVAAIRSAGGFLLRVVRPGAGLEGVSGEHASETELSDDDGLCDARVLNDGTLEEFEGRVSALGAVLAGKVPSGPPDWDMEDRRSGVCPGCRRKVRVLDDHEGWCDWVRQELARGRSGLPEPASVVGVLLKNLK